jgi:sigma-B regulation protein RsbU (phosphoserine phosphatase)
MRPDTQYSSSAEVKLEKGDIVVVLTDGIEESVSREGELFGAERALEVVREHREKPAQQIVEELYRAVRKFSSNAPQIDDVTAVLVKVA